MSHMHKSRHTASLLWRHTASLLWRHCDGAGCSYLLCNISVPCRVGRSRNLCLVYGCVSAHDCVRVGVCVRTYACVHVRVLVMYCRGVLVHYVFQTSNTASRYDR